MPTQQLLHDTYFKYAIAASGLSKDPTTKVGACIVHPEHSQFSTGYNGFPKGIFETAEKWQRPLKYEYVRHAEENAVSFCPFDTHGCAIYVTLQPCHRCLGLLLQNNIKKVYYLEKYANLTMPDVWDDLASYFDVLEHVPAK